MNYTSHTLREYAARETHKALRADNDKERRHHLDIAKALHDAAEYIAKMDEGEPIIVKTFRKAAS